MVLLRSLMVCGAFLWTWGIVVAQPWCTPGATWRSWTFGSQWEIYVETICVGDTIVQGLQGYLTSTRRVGVDASMPLDETISGYVIVDDDILWYAKNGTGPIQLDTLAWFGAEVGDRWSYEWPDEVLPAIQATVTGVGVREFNTVPLRYVAVDLTGMLWSGPTTDTIFERIGPLAIGSVDPLAGYGMEADYAGLICYHDDEVEWIGPAVFPNGCYAPLDVGQVIPSERAVIVSAGSDGAEVVIEHPVERSDGYWSVTDVLGRVTGMGLVPAGTVRTRVALGASVPGTYVIRCQWPDQIATLRFHHP